MPICLVLGNGFITLDFFAYISTILHYMFDVKNHQHPPHVSFLEGNYVFYNGILLDKFSFALFSVNGKENLVWVNGEKTNSWIIYKNRLGEIKKLLLFFRNIIQLVGSIIYLSTNSKLVA